MVANHYDIAIVGAGIVGLSTAFAILEKSPSSRLIVLEKESDVGLHQTGHNSGVIHSGIYYEPGSLKAKLCVQGGRRLKRFCDSQEIPYHECGKLILASDDREQMILTELHRRGRENGVPGLRRIGSQELRTIEPHATAKEALHVPGTAIVDFRRVANALASCLRQRGAQIAFDRHVHTVRNTGSHRLRIESDQDDVEAAYLVNCAGLHADRVATLMGIEPAIRIIPFRGEYYRLRKEVRHMVKGLVYPVPDPHFPFLGVHLTRTITGEVLAGPNAVLALAKEGYSKTTIRVRELANIVTYRGFWALARKHWRIGCSEYFRSFNKGAFLRDLQRLVPELMPQDLVAGGSGVRAQAVGPDGKLIDDFHLVRTESAVHVLNAPSPAATASLSIGHYIANQVLDCF